jgi:hypothetical protein
MYARVVRNQIQPGMMGEWLAIIRGCIVPSLEERDGFQGFVALIDREHGNSIGYSVRGSAADLAAGGDGRELPAADREAGRRAGRAAGP